MGTIEDRVIDAMAALPLLRGLDTKTFARVTAGVATYSLPRGAVIYHQGAIPTGLYVILSGQVKLCMEADDGQQKILDLLGPNACFGVSSLYLSRPHQVTAQVITDAQIGHLAKGALLDEIAANPELAGRVVAQLAARLYQRTGELKCHMLQTGTQRVIGYLLRELPNDHDHAQAVAITLPARKGVIASRLNLTQEHFSRILHELTAAALIEVDGLQVRVRDLRRLRAGAAQ